MSQMDWESDLSINEKGASYFLRGIAIFWDLLEGFKKQVLILCGVNFLDAVMALVSPFIMKFVLDELTIISQTGVFTDKMIFLLALILFHSLFGSAFQHFVRDICFIKVGFELENHWPVLAHKKLLSLDLAFHEKENTGKKVGKVQRGCEKLFSIFDRFFNGILQESFFLVINMTVIFFIDWRLGVLFFLPVYPVFYLNRKLMNFSVNHWDQYDKWKEKWTGKFCQSILNIFTVQSFVKEKEEFSNCKNIREEMKNLDIKVSIEERIFLFLMNALLRGSFAIITAVGVLLLVRKEISLGDLGYILITGGSISFALWGIIYQFSKIIRELVSVYRFNALLSEKEGIISSKESIIPEKNSGTISLRNIIFSYSEDSSRVVDGINLEIEKGKMVALVGPSGGGKSTLTKLITRMADTSYGEILFDGIPIKKISKEWYRSRFAIVKQDVEIFDGTLKENLQYAFSEATSEQIWKAIEVASLKELVTSDLLPAGLETEVGENGVRLSGGQRQRVGIARAYLAILAGSTYLVLDEFTSNLDAVTESEIQSVLEKLRRELKVTIIVIAHRLSTIERSDEIFVIEKGKVTENGNHQKLLQKNGLYAKLVEYQQLGTLSA